MRAWTSEDAWSKSDRESLPETPDVQLSDDYGGLWEMYADSLRGPRALLVKGALIKGCLFAMFGVYCVVQAVLSTEIRSVVLWSLGALWSIAVVTTVKLWWWMEMNRKSTLRVLAQGLFHRGAKVPEGPASRTSRSGVQTNGFTIS